MLMLMQLHVTVSTEQNRTEQRIVKCTMYKRKGESLMEHPMNSIEFN